jgi:hypothetical protein
MNSFGSGRSDEIQLHPTVKPVAMIADAIKDVSQRSGIMLDLFGGSGSTLIAAHKTGRRRYLCELDPVYCDCIIRRWQAYAKDGAVLERTRQSFEEVAGSRQRSAEGPETMDRTMVSVPPAAIGTVDRTMFVPADIVDDPIVCWLPPFHPVLARTDGIAGLPPRLAAE